MSTKNQQRDWVREEVVILVVEYFRTKNSSKAEIEKNYKKISRFLRMREEVLTNIPVSTVFRNYAGIRMQSGRIRCLDPETDYSGMIGTTLQKKIVSEYLENPTKLIKEAESIYKKYENNNDRWKDLYTTFSDDKYSIVPRKKYYSVICGGLQIFIISRKESLRKYVVYIKKGLSSFEYYQKFLGEFAQINPSWNNRKHEDEPYLFKLYIPFERVDVLQILEKWISSLDFHDSKQNPKLSHQISVIDQIYQNNNLIVTDKEILAKARIGQGLFRDELIQRDSSCRICGITNKELLRASHIKPWKDCKDSSEKLNPDNGLLLCAIHDALFDRGLICFDDDGSIVISKNLSKKDISILNLDKTFKLNMNKRMKEFMKWRFDRIDFNNDDKVNN